MKDFKKQSDNIQLNAVEDHNGITTIRGGGDKRDWNGIHYKQGMSSKNVGSTNLSVNIATIPPGGVAYAHIHDGFEVMLYILKAGSVTNLAINSKKYLKTKPATSSTSNRACRTKSSI